MLPFNENKNANAYTTAQLSGATVIDIYDEADNSFSAEGLNDLATAAGYDDIIDMIDKATATGTSVASKLSGKVVQLGKDGNSGGPELKWAPVYLSQDTDKNAILTLWLATDIYKSTWSDGTYSENGTKTVNGSTIYSNTYDGSFIRHQLNGKTGWTTNWGSGSNQSNANVQIGDMAKNFYGSGELAQYVVTPSRVSWQTGSGSNRMKNDPGWIGTNSASYTSDWINDNVWLPSMYEVCDKNIAVNNTATSFTVNGGLWGVNVGDICSVNNAYAWLRSGNSNTYNSSYRLAVGYQGTGVEASYGVRPAIHLNLTKAFDNLNITAPTADTTNFKYTGGTLTYNPKGFISSVMNITGSTASAVGTTTVTVTLKDGYVWGDGATEADGTTPKIYTYDFIIAKGIPDVKPTYQEVEHRYPADELPVLTNSGSTVGTFEWKPDQSPSVGTHEYAYIFTPANTDNWETYEGTIEITFDSPTINSISAILKSGVDIYDIYTADKLKGYLTVTATYGDNSIHPVLSKDYTVRITTNNGKLVAGGTNTLFIQENSSSQFVNLTIPTVLEAKIDSFVLVLLSNNTFTYPVTESDVINALSSVMVKWNYSPGTAEALTDFSSLSIVGTLDVGTQSLKLKSGNVESDAFNVTINKGTYEVTATISDDTVDYSGNAHGLTLSGTLPAGVTAVYLYECAENGYSSSDMPTEAGVYTVTVSFTHDNPNYNAITETKSATLTINKVKYPDADKITFDNKTVSLGGEHSIAAENLPDGVTVKYVYNNEEFDEPPVFSELNNDGYEITAKFTHTNPNYEDIADITAKLIITDKEIYDKSELTVKGDGLTVEDTRVTATYSGEAFVFAPDGKVKDKNGVEVTPTKTEVVYKLDNEVVTEIKDAGTYTVTVKYTMPTDGEYADYEPSFEVKYTFTVNKADFDMSGITFADKSFEYDGEAHSIEIEGELPEWITVSYDGNGKTEAGEYTVTAKFSHSNGNYNAIEEMTAKLTISGTAVIPPVTGDGDEGGSSSNLWLYIAIGVGALLLLGLLLFLLLRRRRADDYDDEYDDEYDYDDDDDDEDEDEEDDGDYDDEG